MPGDRTIVATNLKALRAARLISQEELAVRAGIDRSYISKLENERYAISVDKLGNLAEVLGVEIWEMLHPATAGRIKDRPPGR